MFLIDIHVFKSNNILELDFKHTRFHSVNSIYIYRMQNENKKNVTKIFLLCPLLQTWCLRPERFGSAESCGILYSVWQMVKILINYNKNTTPSLLFSNDMVMSRYGKFSAFRDFLWGESTDGWYAEALTNAVRYRWLSSRLQYPQCVSSLVLSCRYKRWSNEPYLATFDQPFSWLYDISTNVELKHVQMFRKTLRMPVWTAKA